MASPIKVPALQRALNILEVLQKHRRCSISEIIAITGLPRSSVYVLIEDMLRLKLIRQNSDKTIQLWLKLVSLGNAASENLDLKDLIAPYLEKLILQTESLAVHFGIMDDTKAYYVVKRTNPKFGVRVMSREGGEISLVHTAIGKCLLAFQDNGLREQIIQNLDYTQATANSISNPKTLRKELAQIINRGYAYDNAESGLEIRCVAAPVFDFDNRLMGAISVVGTINHFTAASLTRIIELVKRTASSISLGMML
jgi:IclR family KDG regulon transcriptional repressor